MTMVVAPMLSGVADRRGWRVPLLALGVAGMVVALILLRLPTTFVLLLPLMAFLALVRSPISPIADSLIARMAVRHRLDYGRLRVWGSISFAIIALACGAIWERVGYAPMFLAAAVLFVPVVVAALLLDESPVADRRTSGSWQTMFAERSLLALLAATFLIGAALGMDGIFASVFMDRLGGGAVMVGALFGAMALGEMPAMQYGETIAARLGRPRTLLLAYGLLFIAYIGFVFTPSPWLLLVFATVKGLGFGLFFVSTVRLLDERAAEWSATLQAINNAGAWGLAPLIAGPLSGALYDAYGTGAVFAACAVAVPAPV